MEEDGEIYIYIRGRLINKIDEKNGKAERQMRKEEKTNKQK
jgi:hypothetical protein